MLIFAHRGASGHAPENTLLAFELALEMDSPGVELDIQLCEGTPVVIHNATVDDTTSGTGWVEAMRLEQLKQLDAGNGQSIPTLWEVLTLIGGRCCVNVELKAAGSVSPVLTLVDRAVRELNFIPKQFLISAFNHRLLGKWRQLSDDYPLGVLTQRCPDRHLSFACELGAYSINLERKQVSSELVALAHAEGLKVLVYTVDDPNEMVRLNRMGVDGLFTNYPDRALAIFC